MKKFISTLIIYLLSFQLAFGHVIARMPAQVQEHDLSYDELMLELEDYKTVLLGSEPETVCEEESEVPSARQSTPATSAEPEDDEYFLSRLEKNACSEMAYTFDPLNEGKEQDCTVEQEKGFIDQLAQQTMELERQEKEVPAFRLDDPKVRELHQKAEYLLGEVRKYIYNNRIEREKRILLLSAYLESVALPVRDLIVAKRAYMDELEYDGEYFYKSLLPDFPNSMVRENEGHYLDILTSGPNPSTSPFNLKIVQKGFGTSRFEYIPMDSLSRDIVTLLKAPTNKNYLRALKWMTLQMMISQSSLYSKIIGDREDVKIPQSCQSHFNGDIPNRVVMEKNEQTGDEYIEGLLSSNGLLFEGGNYQYLEYFIDNVDKNPMDTGYSGLFPFEEYKIALEGVESDHWHPSLRPSFDDITHFETILQMKLPEASAVYKSKRQVATQDGSGRRRVRKSRNMTYAGAEQFDMIVSRPSDMQTYEVKDDMGYTYEISDVSTFMAEMMVRKGVWDYEDLISANLKNELKSKSIKVDFPSLYGSHVWRHWSLRLLAQAIEDVQTETSKDSLYRYCVNAPSMSSREKREVCGRGAEDVVSSLSVLLRDFSDSDEYVPLRRMQELKFEKYYPFLSSVWTYLRDRTELLPEATMNEYDLIMDQMEARNPWADVRLSYLLARDELVTAKENHIGKRTQTRRGSRMASSSQCFYSHVDQRLENLDKAAKKLGINRTFSLNYSDRILSSSEKEQLWQQSLERHAEAKSRLFNQKVNGQETYKTLESISYQTLLNRDSVDHYLRTEMPYSLSSSENQELEDVLSSESGKTGEFLFELFTLKGQPEQQEKIYEEFARENGIYSSRSAKEVFLELDSKIKKPLMKRAVREAAHARRENIEERLNEFCELEPSDHDRMKTLFYSTTKAQNQINQMAGLDGVPEELLDQIQSMSPQEWSNMWQGLGAGVLTIGAIVATGVCAGLTGGACLVISPMIVGSAIGALGLQANLVRSEYKIKTNSDAQAKQVQFMEDLGFANQGSSANISRTWAWTIMEGLFMLPIVGIVGRSAKLGLKMTYVSAQHVLRNSSGHTFKQAAKNTISESEVRTARYILGMDDLANEQTLKNLARQGKAGDAALKELQELVTKKVADPKMVNEAFENLEKYRHLFSSGQMSMDQMIRGMSRTLAPLKSAIAKNSGGVIAREFGKVSVQESEALINQKTAQVVSQYFGKNPAAFKRLVKRYSGKRLDKATRMMARVESGSGLHRVPLLGRALSGFRKLRHQALYENAAKIKSIESSLDDLVKRGGDLESFILHNIDDLTDIFSKVPMRKMEIPYLFIIQGAPSLGGKMAGTRTLPGILADGIMLRKFFNARSRLVYETYKRQAKEILSLNTKVGAEATYETFKAFQHSVYEASSEMSEAQSKNLLARYHAVEESITQKLYQNITATVGETKSFRFAEGAEVYDLGHEGLKRILFQPQSLKEKALGESIWSSMSTDELFSLSDVGEVAHKAVKELSNYETVDEFQRFLNALRVSVLQRNPDKVEIF